MSVKEYKAGDIIWFSRWDTLCSASIIRRLNDLKVGIVYKVSILSIADLPTRGGSTNCLHSEVYPDRDSCLNAMKAKSEARINSFCGSIHDAKDLIQFMLDHVVCGEDCDWDARSAAIESAYRLGFDISV